MIDGLPDEQRILRDSVSDFLAERSPPASLRAMRDSGDGKGFDPSVWSDLAQLGITGMLVPERHGGLGMGLCAAGLVAHEMGRQLSASPFVPSSVVSAIALAQFGSIEQQAAHLSSIAAGTMIATLAVDEHVRHQPEAIATSVARRNGTLVLNGRKPAVALGHAADLLLVAARLPDKSLGLVVVPPTERGVSAEPVRLVDSHIAAHIDFHDVSVREGDIVPLSSGYDHALDAGRIVLAFELVGCASALLDQTLAYVKQRKQFDRAIAEYQALQHRLAQWHCELVVARAAVWRAAASFDALSPETGSHASVAKAKAGKVALLSGAEAIQMHGGIGMTDDLDVGLFVKRIQTLQAQFGDHRFHAQRFARLNSY